MTDAKMGISSMVVGDRKKLMRSHRVKPAMVGKVFNSGRVVVDMKVYKQIQDEKPVSRQAELVYESTMMSRGVAKPHTHRVHTGGGGGHTGGSKEEEGKLCRD